jgi:thioredoxin reductase (NADPH)
MEIYDIIIVGAGPCGLACAIEAKKNKLNYLLLEKGSITESIRRYPLNMTFFSTSENLELENIPFTTLGMRPSRIEALKYYRRVSSHFNLRINLFTEVLEVKKDANIFSLMTTKGAFFGKKVILATGYYDIPRLIEVEGEELGHVSHYFDEPFKYTNTDVVVVGGANSAIEAALDLFRNGAFVTLVHQFPQVDRNVKYWILPDFENRIKNQEIKAQFDTKVFKITEKTVLTKSLISNEIMEIPADFVFLMTGYMPDVNFLQNAGVKFEVDKVIPVLNKNTFETTVQGLYLAGSIVGGEETAKIFIENGKQHGKVIIDDIKMRLNK